MAAIQAAVVVDFAKHWRLLAVPCYCDRMGSSDALPPAVSSAGAAGMQRVAWWPSLQLAVQWRKDFSYASADAGSFAAVIAQVATKAITIPIVLVLSKRELVGRMEDWTLMGANAKTIDLQLLHAPSIPARIARWARTVGPTGQPSGQQT